MLSTLTRLALASGIVFPAAHALFYGPFDTVSLSSSDLSINATFIPFGATLTSILVNDRYGTPRDLVLGYDNTTTYADPPEGYFGPIVGRYANRIRNATFTLGNETYKVNANEHGGLNSLHGGKFGYSARPWSIVALNESSVTFYLQDVDGSQGFPGTVQAWVEYNLKDNSTWDTRIWATADEETPILLSSHPFWNLDGYEAYDGKNSSILDHTFHLPKVNAYVETDGILIPNGNLTNTTGTALDFTTERAIGSRLNETEGLCGTGCIGYDNAFVQSEDFASIPGYALSLFSPASGIRLSVWSDQRAIQLYSCVGIKGIVNGKASQGGSNVTYTKDSCAVLEMEDIIDGISNPEWGVNQIYGPNRTYEWNASYVFTVEP